ncbi:F-box/kelch-repeat protein At3g61590-like [Lycium barbarum]|uniref:F-box/kelch-repeat protein At3g61590-like n=1 Tax=Lycium barbarum TaxID=112863 RepID=UPI00293F369B|nr:F-box/kelch-repeat protein At3g61590-like [Lycium barbarum]XP_060213325.1 F-box/kelch-repeat protein At3g61590-like [Lycium barbarum]
MKGETSWISHCHNYAAINTVESNSLSELKDEDKKEVSSVLVDFILPDDILERILACLPVASLFRASCVCKRWHEIVKSGKFLGNSSKSLSHKPWYFMFTSLKEPVGYAYDLTFRKWYGIELPCIWTSSCLISSSCGLFCLMDNDSRTELYVCNPITKCCKSLEEPPGFKFSDYNALAMSANRKTRRYSVSIVKSKHIPGNLFQWDISIHIYNSGTMMWTTRLTDVLAGWRGGDESVICDGILYFMIYSTGIGGLENRHGLITYDLSSISSSPGLLMRSFISVPCSLTCGRLINLKEKLIMVGGIGRRDRADIIKGVGIWRLNGTEWQQITRMPHKYFQGFGEFDEVFASSGTDDFIYIQSYGAPALLIFDVEQIKWRWSPKCPVTKRFPLQLFTGFCFEPRLEIAP